MNIVEENGKKMAAVLCVASCFPVVATVYAMETDPGWHGDKYISEDATVVKGWQEIGDKSVYFNENTGDVDKEVTAEATATTVKADITQDVQEAVKESTAVAVAQVNEEQAIAQEAAAVEETTVTEEAVAQETVATEEYVAPVEEYVAPAEEYVAPAEETYTEEYVAPVEETYTEEYVAPVEEYVEPAQEAYVEETYTEEYYVEPAQETYTEGYVEPVQETYVDTTTSSSLGSRIAAAALSLVGVTDGQWCTQIVQQALAGAGVADAYQLWPDQYQGVYGYYTDSPEPGDLIYYYNGGRGVDHIAVYIGDGMAVHGNYNGRTVVASVYVPGGAPQYIRVCR